MRAAAGLTTRLDSQGDKLMHRVVYRNVGGIESIVMLHSIRTQAGAGGERWYEMRLDGTRSRTSTSTARTHPTTTTGGSAARASTAKATSRSAFSYGGGPYIPPIATTLAAASSSARPTSRSTGVTGANINLAPGRKINIGTGARWRRRR